jgi:hypothetical protein
MGRRCCPKICKDGIKVDPVLSQETQISNERDRDFILCCEFASCMKDMIVRLNTL